MSRYLQKDVLDTMKIKLDIKIIQTYTNPHSRVGLKANFQTHFLILMYTKTLCRETFCFLIVELYRGARGTI